MVSRTWLAHAKALPNLLSLLVVVACSHDARSVAGPPPRAAFSTNAAPSGVAPWVDADHWLVEYTGSVDDLAAAVAAVGGRVDRIHPELHLAKVSGLGDTTAAALAHLPTIASATRDVVVQWIPPLDPNAPTTDAAADVLPTAQNPPQSAPFLPLYQWNLDVIQAPNAWATGFQGQGTTVAILDTGIDDTHPEMTGRVDHTRSVAFRANQNMSGGFPDWGDDNFHGTHVASIIASNAFRTASIAPQASLIAVKVLDKNGTGSFADVIAGIVYAVSVRANVVNLSLGAYFPKSSRGGGQLNGLLAKAVNFAAGHGVFVVAAGGNGGINLDHDQNFVEVPAQSGTAFAVSATGPTGQQTFDALAYYSNFGRSAIALAAPGGNFNPAVASSVVRDFVIGPCSRQTLNPVLAACRTGNRYVFLEGTSQATPHVSAAAALVVGRFGGNLTAGDLAARLQQTADDVSGAGATLLYSHGRVNVFAALTQ
jgi:subtilisin family serine protease